MRGDLAGIRAEIDNLQTALGTDIDGLKGIHAAMYAASLPIVRDMGTCHGLEFSPVLAYACRQVGRDDEANALLNRLREQLKELVVEGNIDFGRFTTRVHKTSVCVVILTLPQRLLKPLSRPAGCGTSGL